MLIQMLLSPQPQPLSVTSRTRISRQATVGAKDENRLSILHTLRHAGHEMPFGDLSLAAQIHPQQLRTHLRELVAAGSIEFDGRTVRLAQTSAAS